MESGITEGNNMETTRIFITGDKHGSFNSFFRLKDKNELYDTDILFIAGDARYVWDEDYELQIQTLEQVFPGEIIFIDGNHENFDILDSLEVSTWHGGRVHRLGTRVYHLMRGEIYEIGGEVFFVFGGASSTDKDDRREKGKNWWPQEEPSAEEMEYGRKKLMDNLDRITYVITHESPLSARAYITREKPIEEGYILPQVLDEWYDLVTKGRNFRKWYFGHMHVDQKISDDLVALFNEILVIGTDEKMRQV